MIGTTAVLLPTGLWRNGVRVQMAVVRSMTGADQEFLVDNASTMALAERTSAILARCVARIGDEPVTPDVPGQLVAGDREALLLHLRRITFGEQLDPVIRCPDRTCGKNMDVSLNVGDLLVEPGNESAPQYHERELPPHGKIRFRLPTGDDQEAVARLARTDALAAATALLTRCVDNAPTKLDNHALDAVGSWMEELDPQAEIRLNLTCPECGRDFVSLLDTGAYLFEETEQRGQNLYGEVHLMALHYGWSEADILGLPAAKRRRYMDLLTEALQ